MKRTAKTLAVFSLFCGLSCLLSGCGSKSDSGMSDADQRKIFKGDASKMPDSARQQMNAAVEKGKAGAQTPKPAQ